MPDNPLTSEQIALRDELINTGMSPQQATELVQVNLSKSELAWEGLRGLARNLGMSEQEIEEFATKLDDSIDHVLARHGLISPPAKTKQ